ncbi:MAG TPA: type II toxin-antitoxin system VapC family toxin [Candidatus Nanoarchaeia archaeon]|nr:type II toxin-antitoxin system VapC family toxin [Candidatus Nanoarchaeia archaeon]
MIVLDSSAVITLLEGGQQGEGLREHLTSEPAAISAITVHEVGVGLRGDETSSFDAFLQSVHTLPIDLDVARKSILVEQKLERKGRLIGKLDILIAATCLVHNLPLLTLDRDFREVADLQLVDVR